MAHVRIGTYLGIGYGSSMVNTDMVAWEAHRTADLSKQYTMYSLYNGLPIKLPKHNSYNISNL